MHLRALRARCQRERERERARGELRCEWHAASGEHEGRACAAACGDVTTIALFMPAPATAAPRPPPFFDACTMREHVRGSISLSVMLVAGSRP